MSELSNTQPSMTRRSPETLPIEYYLENFNFLLNHVEQQYSDILSDEELDYARGFAALPADAQRLYVRLAGRKGPLFRTDRLMYPRRYPEIDDVHKAADALVSAGYADHGEDAAAEEWVALLTKDELLQLDVAVELPRTMRRAALVAHLLEVVSPARIMEQRTFVVLRPIKLDILRIWKLLFFGNLTQDFTEFVLNELGITPFEQYQIHRDVRFFENRAILDETLHLYRLAELAEGVIDSRDVIAMTEFLEQLPDTEELTSERLERRRDRLANRVARQLEREGALDEALVAYQHCRAAPSRERRARLHDRRGETDAAIGICWEVTASPEDEAEYEFAVRFLKRLYKKSARGLPAQLPDITSDDFASTEIVLPLDSSKKVESRYKEKQGLANYFVDWRVLEPSLLGKALKEIPLDHLVSVFERLLRDLQNNRSGFPDLIVFPPGGGYRLVEVKGPGDTLQNNQKRWLRHFREVGIPAEVVRVSWQ